MSTELAWRKVARLGSTIGILLVVLGCAAPAPGRSANPPNSGSQAAPAQQRIVTWVLRAEPPILNDRIDRMGLGFPLTVSLAYQDATEAVRPLLAETLPSLEAGSWTVQPDGTMRTTYVLRPGLKWHDGAPLTAADFAFAHQVYTDRNVPVTTRLPETLMSEVIARDDRTLDITWGETYVDAGALIGTQLAPMPRHALQEVFERDPAAFATSSFWSGEGFVGSGPYRLVRWERGVAITLNANPDFVHGKPRIDTIQIKAVGDSNTIVAGFLAGSIDFAEYTAIDVDQGLILEERWKETREGKVYPNTLFGHRYMEFQHRDVPGHQAAIRDVRIRRALGHALDREALAESMQHGYGGVADTGYPTTSSLYPRISQVIARYPYDPRRAEALFADAGWTKGTDGMLHDATGRTFDIEVRVTGEREEEGTIVVSDWRRNGIDARLYVVPRAATTDVENRVNFPGVAISAATDLVPAINVTTGQAPTPANRFTGKNRGSYSNPELDRLYEDSLRTLDVRQRENILVELERILTTDVAQLMLYYQPRVAAVRSGIEGVVPPVRGSYAWNLWEWSLG